ncbi:hypothetical protein UT300003_15360 [Clostridium sardiniense]
MEIFFWIVDLIIPITMIIIGKIYSVNPPTEVSSLCGYRTTRSMSSRQAWVYAHRLSGRIWSTLGIILLIFVVILKINAPMSSEYLSLINAGLGLAVLIIPIPFVESKLKSKFNI